MRTKSFLSFSNKPLRGAPHSALSPESLNGFSFAGNSHWVLITKWPRIHEYILSSLIFFMRKTTLHSPPPIRKQGHDVMPDEIVRKENEWHAPCLTWYLSAMNLTIHPLRSRQSLESFEREEKVYSRQRPNRPKHLGQFLNRR